MPGPTITISPAPGPVARWSNIVVEITDTVPVVLELIRVRPLLGVDHVVAFQSGAAPATAFAYSNFPLISTEAITNGYRYTFQGSWVTSFDVIVDARNATDGSTVSASFLAAQPHVPLALVPPASPALGPIGADDPIVLDMNYDGGIDDSGAFRRVLVAVYDPTTGATVIVHDGDAFLGGFALKSERTLIAGGFRYTVVSDSGWTSSPMLRVFAIDRAGREA